MNNGGARVNNGEARMNNGVESVKIISGVI